jgi:hypothetical protein
MLRGPPAGEPPEIEDGRLQEHGVYSREGQQRGNDTESGTAFSPGQ